MKSRDLHGRGGETMAVARVCASGGGRAGPGTLLGVPGVVRAGKLSWLDDVVQEVIVEAKAGGKRLVRGGDGARTEIREPAGCF